MSQIKKLPSVLAFTRAHFITDAAFYLLTKEEKKNRGVEELNKFFREWIER